MSSAGATLSDLGRQLLACADRELLDMPLDRLEARIANETVRDVLRGVHEAGEASSLREWLEPAVLERWLEASSTDREEAEIATQLRRWLGVSTFGGDDPARLVEIPAIPDDIDGILAWARPYALLGELTRPLVEVLPDVKGIADDVSLVEACLGRFEAKRKGASLLSADAARESARAYLVREAKAFEAPKVRSSLWSLHASAPALRALEERLRAVVGRTDFVELHAVGFIPARPVSLDVESGVARAFFRTGDGEAPVGTRLPLGGFERRALVGECEACRRSSCVHVRALAARLLDACVAPHDRLHDTLVELVRVPSWKRFVEAIAPPREREEASDERLVFRLDLDGERVSVSAVRKKALPGGRFSVGKLVSPAKAARASTCSDRDRPILEAMTRATRTLGAQRVPADLPLLRALVEHPYVELQGVDGLVHVREQVVDVTLAEAPDGLLPGVSLASAPVAPGARPADQSALARHDGASGALVFAPLTPALRRFLTALSSFRGVLPPESYPALAPALASLSHVARVAAPKALRGTERPTPRTLLLRITPSFDEGIDVVLATRALPMGPLWSPGHGRELVSGLEDGVAVFARRDLEWERATAKRALDALGLESHLRLEPFAYRIESTQASLEILSKAARLSDVLAIEWAERVPRFAVQGTVRAQSLSIGLFKRGAWLSLEGEVNVAGMDVAVGRLLDASRRGERFVSIGGSHYVEIERELFERLEVAQLCVQEPTKAPAIAAAALPFFLATLGDSVESRDESTRALLDRVRGQDAGRVQEAIPISFDGLLRGYQREGVAFVLERSGWASGVCLADEMGLGKTLQTIAVLEARASQGPALVLAPTSVVDHWRTEIERFAPNLRAEVHRGTDRARTLGCAGAGTVVVTSYELLLRDRERFDGVRFATQVFDEAQLLKNATTKRARAAASIDADFRIALSGTPIENRLGDLWSLFHLIAPGLLGSWQRFRARFAVPIERFEREDRATALRALVAPFLLRRTKDDVASELPSRTEVVHRIELSQAERDLYDAAVRRARRSIGKRRDDVGRSMQILAELTRLRQLACHPRLVVDDERLESSKLAAFLGILDDALARGHRVLVFSQFTRHLALVEEALAKRGIAFLHLDGSTPAGRRSELVERFQGGEGSVFLISLKAGGTGLNLTAADYVIHLDPWWNPAAEDQASDRAHRLGQDKPVTIVKLVSENTIEERVLALHEGKRRLAASVIGSVAAPTTLDASMLEALLDEAD